MASIFDWSSTAASNTTIDGINSNTGTAPSNVDNLIRSMAAIIRQTFASSLQNFLAGSSGLGVANGGTGLATATGILKGNGTSAMSAITLGGSTVKFLGDDGTMRAPLEPALIFVTDEATTVTTGTSKRTFFAPYNITITDCFTGLSTQSSSGVVTVNIKLNGSTIFSTKPSIDANKDTSLTGTAAVLSTTTAAKGDKFTIDVDAAGTGVKGLQVYLFWNQR